MKCLLLILACVSAAVSIELGYMPGKRYTYEYEAILAHGIPEVFEKDMAVRIFAKAHLDYEDKKIAFLRLEDVKIQTMMGELLTADRIAKIVGKPTALDDVVAYVKKYLEMPVKIKFNADTMEVEVTASGDDPNWCLNMKKALITQFHLPIKNNDDHYQTRDSEVTIVGKCKTTYTIVAEKPYYKVKRVIDLARCMERPDVLQHNIPNTDKFQVKRQGRGIAKTLPSFVRSAAYMHYELQKADSGKFLIRQIVSEGEHDFTMLGDAAGAGKAVGARTQLTVKLLAKEQPIPKDVKKIEKAKICGSGLMFVYDDGSQITYTPEAQKQIENKIKTSHLVDLRRLLTQPQMSAELAQTFTRLISALRRCNRATLEKIFAAAFENEKNVEMKKVVVDAFARVGTLDAVTYIAELMKQGRLPEDYLERALFGLGWIRDLNVDVMTATLGICKEAKIAGDQKLQRICLLSFGTLLNRLMVIIGAEPRLVHNTKHNAKVEDFGQALIDGVTGSQDNEVKINFLKAIGNAGFVSTKVLKAVAGVLRDATMPVHVRVQAAWALRHMARVRPTLVRQYAITIFANPMVDAELRIACYKILINSDLSLHTCQLIASVLGREVARSGPRSNQIVSFIAADARGMMSNDAYDIVMASRARLLLRFIPRSARFGFFAYSKAIKLGVGNGRPAMEVHINKVNGRDSFIPRHLGAKTKLHLPGLSLDLLEIGARMQGIHDILLPFMTPLKGRFRRSIDVLNYIFGHLTHNEGEQKDVPQLTPARISLYSKLFGSEVFYGKLGKDDVVKVLAGALFGENTATEGGITFSKTDIKLDRPFTRAHMLSEARYLIPTLTGIPLKISSKIGMAVKGRVQVTVTGKPQLITANFEEIQTTIKVIPNVAVHMHNKVAAWLPIFETGLIVKNQVVAQPKIHAVVSVTPTGVTADFPTVAGDKTFLEMKPAAHAIIRKEITPGIGEWINVNLGMKQRGLVEFKDTCYAGKLWGIAACVKAKYADLGYLRAKRLPTFPYYLLNTVDIRLTDQDVPAKIHFKYDITSKDKKKLTSAGVVDASGKTATRNAKFTFDCNLENINCEMKWTFVNYWCPGKSCKATTTIDASVQNKIEVKHTHGERVYTSEISFEEEGKLMRMVNTWTQLPKYIQDMVKNYHPHILAYLRPYFSMNVAENKAKQCEVRVHLYDKLTADIFVDAPALKLHRINQELPMVLAKFPTSRLELYSMISSAYGTCRVKGANYIKTTDNVEIQQEIPCTTCPIILAKDARDPEKPAWRILLKLNEQKQHTVVILVKGFIVTLEPDLHVTINGQKVKIQGKKVLAAAGITITENTGKLFVQANIGFKCIFDGSQTVVIVMPWWRNRVHGVCGNNDGEQWTDLATRCNKFIPETLPREFIREWVGQSGKFHDKTLCQLQAKHVQLKKDVVVGYECFTNGRFLRCMGDNCKATKTQELVDVAHRCLPKGHDMIEQILHGDKTIDLPNESVDKLAPVVEHLACQCT